MQDKDEERRDRFRRIDPLRVEITEDTELAYKLQNSTSDDPDLLKRLVECYAGDIYRWVSVLLDYRNKTNPTDDEILTVIRQVFTKAIAHSDKFYGQANVFSWLFALTYQTLETSSIRYCINRHLKPLIHGVDLSDHDSSHNWMSLVNIPEKQRTPLILRYLFGLEIADIANILNFQVYEVHHRLAAGMKRLLAGTNQAEVDIQVLAYMDGLWDDDPDAITQFEQHLETCEICRSSIKAIHAVENSLAESLRNRYQVKTLTMAELGAIEQAILLRIQQPEKRWKPRINLRQVAWIMGIAVLVVGMAVLSVRMTPVEREFPQAQATSTPQLPPIINMQPLTVSAPGSSLIAEPPQFIIPALSNDGAWSVFTAIKVDPLTISNVQPTVQLFNHSTKSIQVISEITGTIQLTWAYWVLAPAISGDGQRIVYVTSTNDPKISGAPCAANRQQTCLDIFLYDRLSEKSRRLTQSWNAGPANGSSLAPTISADGNWVAFWSQADNLVEGGNTACTQDINGSPCLYIYLYNLQSNTIGRIPQVDIRSDVVPGVDRISLSADGRYVGFTFMFDAQIGYILPGNQDSEAVIYDQQTGKFELENKAQDGTPGNGPSSSPVLSGDGRYVAFASSSSNLGVEDNNRHSDVFVRDRTNGAIELVSLASGGTQGNDSSGLTYWTNSVYSINMSSDGRYIVFESAATNLAPGASAECSGGGVNICNLLFVHDRQTGKTDLATALPNQDYSFFPGISADGRWLTFMQPDYDCSPSQMLCSGVMLYDRQMGEMTNLTKYNEGLSSFPLIYSKSLSYPVGGLSLHLVLSPDGKLLALGDNADVMIRLWNLSNGIKSINQDTPDMILETGAHDALLAMAISPGDDWLAASTDTRFIYIWNLYNGSIPYTLRTEEAGGITFSQDGTHIILFNKYETRIFKIDNEQLVEENRFINGPIAMDTFGISPTGDLLATSRLDGSVWLQSLPSGKVVARLGGHGLSADSLAFSQDGSLLAVRSPEGWIDLWKIEQYNTGTPSFTRLSSITTNIYAGRLLFSPDNQYLASSGWQLTLWSLPEGNAFTLANSVPGGVGYASDIVWAGNTFAALTFNGVLLWGK